MSARRLMTAALAAGLLLFAAPLAPAWAADDYLVVSDPEPRSELDREPGWVTLVFSTDSSATYAAIVVHNSAGQNVTTGPLIVEGSNVTTQLMDGLAQDTFTVIYRTEDAEGQPRGGAFQFSYGPGTWTDVDDMWVGEEEQPPEIDDPGPAATPVQTATPSSAPTPTPSPSQTQTPSTDATPTAGPTPSQTPVPISSEPNLTGWLIGAGVLLVVLAIGGWAISRRLRNRPRPPADGPAA